MERASAPTRHKRQRGPLPEVRAYSLPDRVKDTRPRAENLIS
jgi:hypothetical protein